METIWAPVISPADVPESKVPSSRSKHATVLHGQYLYLLGGRNGNVPLKDFWRYCIGKLSTFIYVKYNLLSFDQRVFSCTQ